MKNLLIYVLFLVTLFSCYPNSKNSCTIETASFNTKNNYAYITIKTNKNCNGVTTRLTYNNRIYILYTNMKPEIINNAPPCGFSIKAPNGDFISLGVDKNIIERNLPINLSNESKIELTKNSLVIRWVIKTKNINKLSNISIGDITIKHPSYKDCRLTYNNYLSTPKRYKTPAYPFEQFLSFCKSTWKIEKKNGAVKEIFRLSNDDLEKLKREHKEKLLDFLGFKKIEGRKTGNSCVLHISIVDSKSYRQMPIKNFKLSIEKLNKETFKSDFRGNSIKVFRGLYVIKVKSSKYSGKSAVVNCDKGDYYVYILVRSGS